MLGETKPVNRIAPNFLETYIHLLETFCKILEEIKLVVLELKFLKILNWREEEAGICIALCQENWNLAQLQTLIIQQLQDKYKSN